jgi:hypothetical protein
VGFSCGVGTGSFSLLPRLYNSPTTPAGTAHNLPSSTTNSTPDTGDPIAGRKTDRLRAAAEDRVCLPAHGIRRCSPHLRRGPLVPVEFGATGRIVPIRPLLLFGKTPFLESTTPRPGSYSTLSLIVAAGGLGGISCAELLQFSMCGVIPANSVSGP